jgi:kynureninase
MGAMQFEPTLEFARAQDEADPLRAYRERFHFPSLGTRELVYFTGHSLGLQPKAVRAAVELEWRSTASKDIFIRRTRGTATTNS